MSAFAKELRPFSCQMYFESSVSLRYFLLLSDLVWFRNICMYADRNLYVSYRSFSTLAATHRSLKAYVPLIQHYQCLCAFIGPIDYCRSS